MKRLLDLYRKQDRTDITESNQLPHAKKKRQVDEKPNELEPPKHIVDFLIIGVQKGGTMALVKNLNKHPDIYVKSECQFFTFCWEFGVDWYRNHLRTSKKIVGEKTPEYIYCDDCAPRIKQVCGGDLKFLLALRDPIKRAYSSWNMQVKRGVESLPFEECIDRELNTMMSQKRTFGFSEFHYIQRGFYMDQIERFLHHFPDKSKLLILISERLQQYPDEYYQKIYDYIGARKDINISYEDDHTATYESFIPRSAVTKLLDIYTPHNERLFEFLGYRIPEWEHIDDNPVANTTSADTKDSI